MASWGDVDRLARRLPGAERATASEGSPAYDIGHTHFARWREDDGRPILQFWCSDPGDAAHYLSRTETFFRVDESDRSTSVWAWLDELTEQELDDILTESWASCAPRALVRAHLGG